MSVPEEVANTMQFVFKILTTRTLYKGRETVVIGYPIGHRLKLNDAVISLGLLLHKAMIEGDLEVAKYVQKALMHYLPTAEIPGEIMTVPYGYPGKKSLYVFNITTWTLGLMLGGALLELEEYVD